MARPIFTGAGVAIVTPFDESGVNFKKLEELIDFQI
ncbi:MAG: 4-hydroxy-tetrahydrodipicolinate synthase, partial [Clostridiales bacterium]|nr:4-hydroxy-tetrahydrodipicolinate synthase [Clostridiales bacterium]